MTQYLIFQFLPDLGLPLCQIPGEYNMVSRISHLQSYIMMKLKIEVIIVTRNLFISFLKSVIYSREKLPL